MSEGIPINDESFEALANTDTLPPDPAEFECTICGYRPRAGCTNPKEALRKHMQRYHKHSDTETAVDAIVEDVLQNDSHEQECQKLLEDIEILQVKFPDLPYKPDIHPDSSYEKLKRTKNTLVRLISDRSGADAAFSVMLVGCRGAEMMCRITQVGDIDGRCRYEAGLHKCTERNDRHRHHREHTAVPRSPPRVFVVYGRDGPVRSEQSEIIGHFRFTIRFVLASTILLVSIYYFVKLFPKKKYS